MSIWVKENARLQEVSFRETLWLVSGFQRKGLDSFKTCLESELCQGAHVVLYVDI